MKLERDTLFNIGGITSVVLAFYLGQAHPNMPIELGMIIAVIPLFLGIFTLSKS